MDRLKKHAQLGQWKTPPNAVYAQAQQQHDTSATSAAASSSLGTKMQLMGLVQAKKASPASISSPVPIGTSLPTMPAPAPPSHFMPFASMPSASPIDASPFAMADDSPTRANGDKKNMSKRPPNATPPMKKEGSQGSPAGEKPSSKAHATPEDKQKMLAHSRTMARLRRQQQRVLTDSLESEFFELCVSAAYLKAALSRSPSNAPLQSAEVDTIYVQATERSLEAMSSNIPQARSLELKAHAVSSKSNMPQAHIVPTLKLDDPTAVHLAVTVGSRRESLSFSSERRKGALAWSTSGVKDLLSDLNKDALPIMLATSCARDNPEEQVLASRLKLTAQQKEKLSEIVDDLRSDVTKTVAMQHAADMLFSDAWLSLPKTDAFLEQVRDTTTTEQMSKLISWSITNETQISTLKLGSVPATPLPTVGATSTTSMAQ